MITKIDHHKIKHQPNTEMLKKIKKKLNSLDQTCENVHEIYKV
jgi:predicted GTPase